jgi:hypothetical protein
MNSFNILTYRSDAITPLGEIADGQGDYFNHELPKPPLGLLPTVVLPGAI